MSNYLFLDDFREPKDAFYYTGQNLYLTKSWCVVRSYEEFVKYIEENSIPHTISFDHDLSHEHYTQEKVIPYDSYEEKTGFHCAKWLIEYSIEKNLKLPTTILIHSMNPVGSENIKSLFNTFNKFN